MEVKEKGLGNYLDQTRSDFTGRCSQNQLLKLWIQMHYRGWIFKMVWKFLNFHYFIENILKFLPTFYSFDLFLTIFGPFGLIWCCRGPFWAHFDRVFDLFLPIIGIISELAYRLWFHIYLNFVWPYDHFILTLGTNPFHDIMKPSCYCYKWYCVNGIAFLYIDALVRSYFSFGAHAEIPPLGCGSPILVPPCPWARASYSSWTLWWPFP